MSWSFLLSLTLWLDSIRSDLLRPGSICTFILRTTETGKKSCRASSVFIFSSSNSLTFERGAKKCTNQNIIHLFHHLLGKHPDCPVCILHKEIESNCDEAGEEKNGWQQLPIIENLIKDKMAMPILFSLSAASSSSWATFLKIWILADSISVWNLTRCRLSAPRERSSAAACTWWSSQSTWAPTGCPSSPSRCPTHCSG